MHRGDDYTVETTYQWLEKEFPTMLLHPDDRVDLVAGITEKLAQAYEDGRGDGIVTAGDLIEAMGGG